jgi:hypothetical protein
MDALDEAVWERKASSECSSPMGRGAAVEGSGKRWRRVELRNGGVTGPQYFDVCVVAARLWNLWNASCHGLAFDDEAQTGHASPNRVMSTIATAPQAAS